MKPEEFVTKVVSLYTDGVGIFKNKVNAEELVPRDLDDLGRALYIFYVLQLDYAMKSQILYRGAKQLHSKNKKFFTPRYIAKLSGASLENYLKQYLHPRYINEAIKRFRLNTVVLAEKYNGDPRKIFGNTNRCQDVVKRLKDFRGFGPKIGNFFIRTMINTFNYKYSDIDSILPPVDVHDVKIAYLLKYTESDGMTQKNINVVKRLWNKACTKSGESWLVFDKALWLLGSEGKPKSKEDLLNLIID
jgi:hypothetical protein